MRTVRESRVFRAPIAFNPRIPPWRTLMPVLVWVECCICGLEVRFERVWVALTGPWVGGRGRVHHACATCCPLSSSVQEAAELMSEAIVPRVPPMFPPPPPRPQPSQDPGKRF